MKKSERISRIIARGEFSNHSHVVTGDATVRNENGEIIIEVHGEATIRHLLEDAWMKGQEVWTEEHADIALEPGTYKYIPQLEYHPYEDVIQRVRD